MGMHEETAARVERVAYEARKLGDDLRAALDALSFRREYHEKCKALLSEWLEAPFYETREQWEAWVKDFRPRVQAAVRA